MNFRELARLGAEPSPTPLGAFVVEYLEANGASRRGDLIGAAEAEWRLVAGRDMTVSLTSRMKKAHQMLEAQGSIRKTGAYGRYELSDPSAGVADAPAKVVLHTVSDPVDDEDEEVAAEAEVTRGEGEQNVYCYFLDAYRQQAERAGLDRWPMKIGMTTGEVRHRIAQHATGLPEAPTLAIVFRTDNAALLERLIHLVLTYWGRRHENSGGAEWFMTNPDEILDVYNRLDRSQTATDVKDQGPIVSNQAVIDDPRFTVGSETA